MSFNPYAPPKADLTPPMPPGDVKLFSFAGRMARTDYIVAVGAVVFPLGMIATWLFTVSVGPVWEGDKMRVTQVIPGLMMLGFALVSMVMLVVSTLRRLRDLAMQRVWVILLLVPIVNVVLVMSLVLWPSTPQANPYGPPPITTPAHRIGAAMVLFFLAVLGLYVAIR